MTASPSSAITPPDAGRYQYRYCITCGKVYQVNVSGTLNEYCPEHRKELADDRKHRREKDRYAARWVPDFSRRIVIISDPLPALDGGFEPGAVLDPFDWFITLYAGNLGEGISFRYQHTSWTITGKCEVTDENGVTWRVTYKGRLQPGPAKESHERKELSK